jgi:hypothetical protein
MNIMDNAKCKLNYVAEFPDVILYLKNMGLIKDKSKNISFMNMWKKLNHE